jgi:hypothetical protein
MNIENLLAEIKSNPWLSCREIPSRTDGDNKIFGYEIDGLGKNVPSNESIVRRIVAASQKVSCFGDAVNGGDASEVRFDNLGRACLPMCSQKPSSTEKFLKPIKTAFILA